MSSILFVNSLKSKLVEGTVFKVCVDVSRTYHRGWRIMILSGVLNGQLLLDRFSLFSARYCRVGPLEMPFVMGELMTSFASIFGLIPARFCRASSLVFWLVCRLQITWRDRIWILSSTEIIFSCLLSALSVLLSECWSLASWLLVIATRNILS